MESVGWFRFRFRSTLDKYITNWKQHDKNVFSSIFYRPQKPPMLCTYVCVEWSLIAMQSSRKLNSLQFSFKKIELKLTSVTRLLLFLLNNREKEKEIRRNNVITGQILIREILFHNNQKPKLTHSACRCHRGSLYEANQMCERTLDHEASHITIISGRITFQCPSSPLLKCFN